MQMERRNYRRAELEINKIVEHEIVLYSKIIQLKHWIQWSNYLFF